MKPQLYVCGGGCVFVRVYARFVLTDYVSKYLAKSCNILSVVLATLGSDQNQRTKERLRMSEHGRPSAFVVGARLTEWIGSWSGRGGFHLRRRSRHKCAPQFDKRKAGVGGIELYWTIFL